MYFLTESLNSNHDCHIIFSFVTLYLIVNVHHCSYEMASISLGKELRGTIVSNLTPIAVNISSDRQQGGS